MPSGPSHHPVHGLAEAVQVFDGHCFPGSSGHEMALTDMNLHTTVTASEAPVSADGAQPTQAGIMCSSFSASNLVEVPS